MALQIAQWNLELNLTGIPANRAYSPTGPNSILILPNQKNVFIKKICLDVVYNNSGDIIIKDYNFNFSLVNFNNIIIGNNYSFTDLVNTTGLNFNINKNNNIININEYAGGILPASSGALRNSLILNNSINPITNTVSFLISIYYDK